VRFGGALDSDARKNAGRCQYLAARLVDEMELSLVPILLGRGERLLEHVGDPPPRLEVLRVVPAVGVTHLRYRVG